MGRPAVYMYVPDDDVVITFSTLDQAEEWLVEQLDAVRRYKAEGEKSCV